MAYTILYHARNGVLAGHVNVFFENAGMFTKFLDVLWDEGLIRGYKKLDNRVISLFLLYVGGSSQIQSMTLLSSPGRRLSFSCADVYRLSRFTGTLIISNSKGIMTGKKALELGEGGEPLAYFK